MRDLSHSITTQGNVVFVSFRGSRNTLAETWNSDIVELADYLGSRPRYEDEVVIEFNHHIDPSYQ